MYLAGYLSVLLVIVNMSSEYGKFFTVITILLYANGANLKSVISIESSEI